MTDPHKKEYKYYHGSGHYQNDGIDPHEEDFLDLPELNQHNIYDNKYAILQNRIMIVGMFALCVSMTVGSFIVTSHDIHECENRLYNKLMEKQNVTSR